MYIYKFDAYDIAWLSRLVNVLVQNMVKGDNFSISSDIAALFSNFYTIFLMIFGCVIFDLFWVVC